MTLDLVAQREIAATPALDVAYVTMAFPAASEPFACTDVRALATEGVAVSVYAMRPPRTRPRGASRGLFSREGSAAAMLAERGLTDVAVSHGSLTAVARGVWVGLRRPRALLDLLRWILRYNWRTPTHLIKSLALVPRSLDVFTSLEARPPNVLHLFWGHYPAVLGYLIRRHRPDVVLSVFLGAYDLERHYPGTVPVARGADVVWTHAHANVEAIASLGVPRDCIRVVHRGIDVTAFSGTTSDKVPGRILTAGRLTPDKGMDDVLAVFAKVLARWPHASLIVLGAGPEHSRLVAMAEALGVGRAVHFRGHVGGRDVRAEMARATLFVLMSKSPTERLPNVVKEAMASRCACVVTETPGIRELVRHGSDGVVVAQGDVEGAARWIDGLLGHPERTATMGAVAAEQIVERFDVRRSMRTYRDSWSQLVAQRQTWRMTGLEPDR